MYISAFRTRAKSSEAVEEICRVFHETLRLTQAPGWIRGACSTKVGEPCEVVIYELWGTLADFQFWEKSEARRQLVDQTQPFIESPWRMELFTQH